MVDLHTQHGRIKTMATKLYVGNLSYNTTDASLLSAFEQAGTVETASVITDRESGRSKGFGFVEMATEEEAQAAINMWNGKELDGRSLNVNEARPKEDRPRNGGFRGGNNFGGYRG